ncbi:hypothetical protein [Saccharothrix sp.]|nr:hypothetical protein [Saccharothrix sp.]
MCRRRGGAPEGELDALLRGPRVDPVDRADVDRRVQVLNTPPPP